MKKSILTLFTLMTLFIPFVEAQECCPTDCAPPCPPPCCPPVQFNPCGNRDPFSPRGDFAGFYAGLGLGVSTHTANRSNLGVFFPPGRGGNNSLSNTNFALGLQLGYDWQCKYKLVGLVADWYWTNTRSTLELFDQGSFDTIIGRIHAKSNWFTTMRARAGMTICDALVYVTGGGVAARFDTRWHKLPSTGSQFDTTINNTRWGWVGGAGAELMVGCKWSVATEILFMQFSNRRYQRTLTPIADVIITAPTPTNFTFGHQDAIWIGRIIVNYRLGTFF